MTFEITPDNAFAFALRLTLARMGMSHTEFAQTVGVGLSTAQTWLRVRSPMHPSTASVIRVADALGVFADDLLPHARKRAEWTARANDYAAIAQERSALVHQEMDVIQRMRQADETGDIAQTESLRAQLDVVIRQRAVLNVFWDHGVYHGQR